MVFSKLFYPHPTLGYRVCKKFSSIPYPYEWWLLNVFSHSIPWGVVAAEMFSIITTVGSGINIFFTVSNSDILNKFPFIFVIMETLLVLLNKYYFLLYL